MIVTKQIFKHQQFCLYYSMSSHVFEMGGREE